MGYNIDLSHSHVQFSVRHMMISKVRGEFTKWSGTVNLDPANPANTTVDIEIHAASISSRDEQRDGHLRSPDFLNADAHPTLHFKSTKVEVKDDEKAKLYGDLTILMSPSPGLGCRFHRPGQEPGGITIYGFEASTKINRDHLGLQWNVALETGGWLVGKDIQIHIEIEFRWPRRRRSRRRHAKPSKVVFSDTKTQRNEGRKGKSFASFVSLRLRVRKSPFLPAISLRMPHMPPPHAIHKNRVQVRSRSAHPNSRRIFSLLAISTAGSPGRRAVAFVGMGWPVIGRAVSTTSFTLKPFRCPDCRSGCHGRAPAGPGCAPEPDRLHEYNHAHMCRRASGNLRQTSGSAAAAQATCSTSGMRWSPGLVFAHVRWRRRR